MTNMTSMTTLLFVTQKKGLFFTNFGKFPKICNKYDLFYKTIIGGVVIIILVIYLDSGSFIFFIIFC
jgi:hypothetical protein